MEIEDAAEWTRWLLLGGALLHLAFAIAEFLPAGEPWMLRLVRRNKDKKRPADAPLLASPDDRRFVSTILRNAATYNLIVAAGFAWTVYPAFVREEGSVHAEAGMLFGAGAAAAGLVGLSISRATIVQFVVGALCFAGCLLIRYPHLLD